MAEKRMIYCPRCGRKVATWDGRTTTNVICSCRNCKKQVVFDVASRETIVKPLPERNTSSGMTFY